MREVTGPTFKLDVEILEGYSNTVDPLTLSPNRMVRKALLYIDNEDAIIVAACTPVRAATIIYPTRCFIYCDCEERTNEVFESEDYKYPKGIIGLNELELRKLYREVIYNKADSIKYRNDIKRRILESTDLNLDNFFSSVEFDLEIGC